MSDFDSMLSSLLSDPAQMEKISSMAKSLMGEGGAEKAEEEAPLDMGMLKKLGGVLGILQGDPESFLKGGSASGDEVGDDEIDGEGVQPPIDTFDRGIK